MNPWLDKLCKFVKSELGLDKPAQPVAEGAIKPKPNRARQTVAIGIVLAIIAMTSTSWGRITHVVPEIDPSTLAAPIALLISGCLILLDRRF